MLSLPEDISDNKKPWWSGNKPTSSTILVSLCSSPGLHLGDRWYSGGGRIIRSHPPKFQYDWCSQGKGRSSTWSLMNLSMNCPSSVSPNMFLPRWKNWAFLIKMKHDSAVYGGKHRDRPIQGLSLLPRNSRWTPMHKPSPRSTKSLHPRPLIGNLVCWIHLIYLIGKRNKHLSQIWSIVMSM